MSPGYRALPEPMVVVVAAELPAEPDVAEEEQLVPPQVLQAAAPLSVVGALAVVLRELFRQEEEVRVPRTGASSPPSPDPLHAGSAR